MFVFFVFISSRSCFHNPANNDNNNNITLSPSLDLSALTFWLLGQYYPPLTSLQIKPLSPRLLIGCPASTSVAFIFIDSRGSTPLESVVHGKLCDIIRALINNKKV